MARSQNNSDNPLKAELKKRLFAVSKAMEKVCDDIFHVVTSDCYVLIRGESGVGKEVCAQSIHDYSERGKQQYPFVGVNCGAIPESLWEAEVFGYVKGAFSNAIRDHDGYFSQAGKGTLFLDEVAELSLNAQVKLLRVLQTRQYYPIGSTKVKTLDARVLFATNENLEQLVEQKRFRPELYHRINVYDILIPPLRKRQEDIPLLVEHFLSIYSKQLHSKTGLTEELGQVLYNYHWQDNNIRELENVIHRLMIRRRYEVADIDDIPEKYIYNQKFTTDDFYSGENMVLSFALFDKIILSKDQKINLKQYMSYLEKHLIQQALAHESMVKTRAACKLGLNRTTLLEKMRRYGLDSA